MTGLSASTEEEIDTWCALRGFPRAEIRVRIQPFADSTWVERFPLYARALQGELAMYDKVVGDAMARQGGNRDTLDALEQASAFTAAANEFSARCARGRLTATVRLRFSYRLAMDQARLSDPQVETYELRPIESSAYLVRAPLPERHDLVSWLQQSAIVMRLTQLSRPALYQFRLMIASLRASCVTVAGDVRVVLGGLVSHHHPIGNLHA
jgi:hypothetical protein